MAKRFGAQIQGRVFRAPRRGLIEFLEKLQGSLSPSRTVGEEFSQQQLAEMAAEFSLTASDWNQLYRVIHRL